MLLLLLSRFSRVRLCATPWTAAYQVPPSMGFSRQEYWSGLPLPSPNVPLVSPVFLKRCLVVPILQFSSISLHFSFQNAFFSLLAILCNSAFSWIYFSLFPLLFTSFLSSAICKGSLDNHFVFLHFFFIEMVLITASCKVL